jgi:glycosyltransferase involved in cell wall biosynthesis
MAEAVSDGVEGYLVPTRDPRALAEALAKLWDDPDGRLAMGHAGRRRVIRDFSLDEQLDAFASLVQRVA